MNNVPRRPQNHQEAISYLSSNLRHMMAWGVAMGVGDYISKDAFRDVAYGFMAYLVVRTGLQVAALKDLAPNISYRRISQAGSAAGILATVAFAAYGYHTSSSNNQPSMPTNSSAVPAPVPAP